MDNKNTTNRNLMSFLPIVVAILIVGIVIFGMYFVIQTVRQTTGDLLSPVNALGTEAARVLNPTPTIIPDPQTIIHEIQTLARLETVQYNMEKVITAKSGVGSSLEFLFGEKLLFIAYGEVIAGVDMQELKAEDMVLKNGVLYVTLPPAEVFVATLDNDKSYVYDRETGLLTRNTIDLETLARQAAEQAILEAALDDGILEQAEINAEHYMQRLLRALGYPDVVIEFAVNE